MVVLEKGDSWTVPKGASHTYNIVETFTAVEATSPPAEVYKPRQRLAAPAIEALPGEVDPSIFNLKSCMLFCKAMVQIYV